LQAQEDTSSTLTPQRNPATLPIERAGNGIHPFTDDTPSNGVDVPNIDDNVKAALNSGKVLSRITIDEFNNFLSGDLIFETTDTLVREKGMRVLDKMLDQDADIKNAYHLKKAMRLSSGWRIDPYDCKCVESEFWAEFVRWNFANFLETSIDAFLMKMWDGMRQGFKVAEIVWDIIPDGKFKGMIGIRRLIVRNSRNYSFKARDLSGELDPFGLIEGISPTGMESAYYAPRRLPVDKFVIWTYNALDDDIQSRFGNSDFRVLWRYFYGSLIAHTHRLRSGETFSRPNVVVSLEEGMFTKKQQAKIRDDMGEVYNRVVTIIPKGAEWKLVETQRTEPGMHELMKFHSEQLDKGQLLGPFVQGAQERGVTLMKAQFQTFIFVLDWLGIDTSQNIMGRQLIHRLINLNTNSKLYPKFVMPKLSKNSELMGTFIKDLVEAGVISPTEEWIRPFLDIPAPNSDDGANPVGDGDVGNIDDEGQADEVNKIADAADGNGGGVGDPNADPPGENPTRQMVLALSASTTDSSNHEPRISIASPESYLELSLEHGIREIGKVLPKDFISITPGSLGVITELDNGEAKVYPITSTTGRSVMDICKSLKSYIQHRRDMKLHVIEHIGVLENRPVFRRLAVISPPTSNAVVNYIEVDDANASNNVLADGVDINRSAKAIIRDGQERILVLKDKGTLFWDFPGGHMQGDETLEDAVRREVEEECGMRVSASHHLFTETLKLGDEMRPVDFFKCDANGDIKLSDEHTDSKFATPTELRELNMGAFAPLLDRLIGDKPQKLAELRSKSTNDRTGLVVQTLILDRATFNTLDEAKKWVTSHGFKIHKEPDITAKSYRFRQEDPSRFVRGSFRTVLIRSGVQAVVARLK
jgi:8-oxo-dGTP pyrophosphatase MutT (NUDIX family)